MLQIQKNKYGYNIQYNNKIINCLCEKCECEIPIKQIEKVWYIYIKLSHKAYEIIKQIEDDAEKNMNTNGYSFFHSLSNTNILQVKIPYRYKKFEAEFFDINKNRIISSDIKEFDKINVHLKCKNIYTNDSKQARLAWCTQLIIKH